MKSRSHLQRWLIIAFGVLIFATGRAQERVIRAGDAVEIVVFEHQELSRKVIISEAGTINYP